VKSISIGGNTTVNSILKQVQTSQTNATNETNAAAASETNVSAGAKKLPGELAWQKPLPLRFESAYKEPADPVIYGGRIFVTKNNRLYIISVEGKLQRSVAVAEEGVKITKPAVSDGVVYVGSDNGGIYAYSTYGEFLWKKDAGSEKYGASPTASAGIVAVPSIDKGVMVFDKTGEVVAQVDSDSVYSAPLILDKGNTLVFATESGNIVSYDIGKKAQNWSKGYNERFLYPLVGTEEIIAVSRADGKVIAVKPEDGSLLWSQTFEEIQKTRINPGYTAGKLILANNDTKSIVIVIDGASGQVISRTSFASETIAPPFILDRIVYIGTDSGKVYSYNVGKKKYDWTYNASGNSISMVVADREGIYALSKEGMLKITR
jgi:outer membrane protein assembly factor BamB